MPTLERHDEVFVIDLGDDLNRQSPAWVAELNALLDEVEGAPAPRALVTAARGDYWSMGLDLEWLAAHRDDNSELLDAAIGLWARMLVLPVPAVAALQGHAFAGGAILALAHDRRVMRADRGYLCLPEVDVGVVFSPGVVALLRAKMSPPVFHEAVAVGRRYGGDEALSARLVDETCDEHALLERALESAATLAPKDPATLGAIKATMYADALAALGDRKRNRVRGDHFDRAIAILAAQPQR